MPRLNPALFALVAICAAFALGGFALRVAGEHSRLFWSDEAVTALRIAGHTRSEFLDALQGRTATAAEVLAFAGRSSEREPISKTVSSLAAEDAKHPPLYYVVSALWTRIAGTSIVSLRLPALIFGLLVPFAAGWLCLEIFGNRLAALLGFSLAAVSPMLIVYSQQAKEYSLWALLFAVATAALLRAQRTGRPRWWILYGVVAVLGMYTDGLFVITLAAHAVYAAFRLRASDLRRFAIAACIAIAAFIPWAVVIARTRTGLADSLSWSAGAWPLVWYLKSWTFEAGATFFDLQYAHGKAALMLLPLALLVCAAIYWCVARSGAANRTMIAALLAVPVLALVISDLVLHDHRSTVPRYGTPIWLMLIVCVAGYLAFEIRRHEGAPRSAWIGAAALLMAAGALCGYTGLRAPVWWDNDFNGWVLADSKPLDATRNALVIVPQSSGRWADALDLAFYLSPDVRMQLVAQNASSIPLRTNAYLLGDMHDALELSDSVGCCVRQIPIVLPRERPDAMLLWIKRS